MKVFCHTNLDVHQEIWPSELSFAPQVGMDIESAKEYRQHQYPRRLSLTVCNVAIKYSDIGWYLDVELSCKGKSVNEFHEYYKKLTGY